jgi:glucose/arabinose dehydrogenase
MNIQVSLCATLLLALSCSPASPASPGAPAASSEKNRSRLPISEIRLPPGFSLDVYSDQVPNARQMALSSNGTLYVGSRSEGKVYAVVDRDRDGHGDQVFTIARGLDMPSGIAWRDGALYVGAVSRVLRYDGIDGRLQDPPKPAVISDSFPDKSHHGWKFIAFGPDGLLYVPVGAPCNICDEENPIYASITRMKPDGSGREIFARGIRNTVGFDWDPGTKELWFTENGRDRLGNDVPPDELNHAPKAGMHFGFPYCHGNGIADPEFGKNKPCSQLTPPARELGPHVAAIGMRFYTGSMFPAAYRNRIFLAEHGSWNRDTPIGYRVMMVRLEGGKAVSYEPFAEGWLRKDGHVWGRPADVLVMPDGALLVSDDEAGAIYRITYKG